ncbi:MAG: thioredoxin family protein [Acidimicrobiia bacterium]|nr:thioredoxin family protein [Acidimicrobiia bacterium]
MRVTLQYFNGCPNWKETEAHIETLKSEGVDVELARQLIETPEAAEQYGFRGSPTIIIDGSDPFADPDAPIGLSCRVYATEDGYAGSPSLDQLRAALRKAS